MQHDPNCTGCPHCDSEMAALLSDYAAGRHESASSRLTALTQRTLRTLRASSKHPAYRETAAARTAPSPSSEHLAESVRKFQGHATPDSAVREALSTGHTAIGPAPVYPKSTATVPPPCMVQVIKERNACHKKR